MFKFNAKNPITRYYIVAFFVAMLALAFSSFGHIRLGRDGEKPESPPAAGSP